MGRLFDLIQDHLDKQEYDVSERQFAMKLGVSPTTVSNWREPKKLIAKEHLVGIARVTRVPYARVLQALLEDIDYWYEESDGDAERSAAPMNGEDNVREMTKRERMQLPVKKAARQDPKKT